MQTVREAQQPAPDEWRKAIVRAFLSGAITFQEMCWLIKSRGSSHAVRQV